MREFLVILIKSFVKDCRADHKYLLAWMGVAIMAAALILELIFLKK